MEVEALEVVVSNIALKGLEQVYEHGIEAFALNAATLYIEELILKIEMLSVNYLVYPECRYLATKSRKYRNIIHGSYLVIYRVTSARVEVLNVIHGSRSITTVRSSRKINI